MAKVARLDWLAKAGFAARGMVYILFGWIALSARGKPEGGAGGSENSKDAAKTLLDLDLGDMGLWAVALGFFFAAGLQVRKAWTGSQMKQCAPDTPRVAKTIGQIGLVTRGIVFAAIGYSFIREAQAKVSAKFRVLRHHRTRRGSGTARLLPPHNRAPVWPGHRG